MSSRTIRVDDEVEAHLEAHALPGETRAATVRRLLDPPAPRAPRTILSLKLKLTGPITPDLDEMAIVVIVTEDAITEALKEINRQLEHELGPDYRVGIE